MKIRITPGVTVSVEGRSAELVNYIVAHGPISMNHFKRSDKTLLAILLQKSVLRWGGKNGITTYAIRPEVTIEED